MLNRSKELAEEFSTPRSETDTEEKIRSCLICRKDFPSAWAGERVCRSCKSTSTWRNGIA
jgi:uncharacterized paraquat-inducible protein A